MSEVRAADAPAPAAAVSEAAPRTLVVQAVAPVSAGRVGAFFGGVLGIVLGVGEFVGNLAKGTPTALGGGFAALFVEPVLAALAAGVTAALFALVYNALASSGGGLELTVR